jgi:hypothetical protein
MGSIPIPRLRSIPTMAGSSGISSVKRDVGTRLVVRAVGRHADDRWPAPQLVVTGGKPALFDAVDAATGACAFSADFGLQNLVTAIDPRTGATINAAVSRAGKAKLLCPSPMGAQLAGDRFNPRTNVLYVPLVENCSDYTYAPRSGRDRSGASTAERDADGPTATVTSGA